MLLIDDILLFPINSIFWVFRRIHETVKNTFDTEIEDITAELSEIYMMLETGILTEAEFNVREKELLDRLDELQDRDTYIEN